LPFDDLGSINPFEGFMAQLAVLTDLFDFKESSVGVKGDLPQGGQFFLQAANAKVMGVVDSGFGSQRALL
jgi:hypothetical protein